MQTIYKERTGKGRERHGLPEVDVIRKLTSTKNILTQNSRHFEWCLLSKTNNCNKNNNIEIDI
jgi:hypothetical protein